MNNRDDADSAVKHYDVLKTILPDGDVWNFKDNGEIDNLLKAIGEIFDEVNVESHKLVHLRDPLKTDYLKDIEREYGESFPSIITEQQKRTYLHALAFATKGNASKDYIQTRLNNAGFPVTVIVNDPAIDPAEYIRKAFNMCCIPQSVVDVSGGISYCGHEDATCGSSGGEIFVDGINQYDTPTDPDTWSHVFFVGGITSGGLLILDANMEYPGITYWPKNVKTSAIKDIATKNTGARSLRIADVVNREEQELYPDTYDATLVAAFRFYDLQQDLGYFGDDTIYEPLFEDFNMAMSGTTYWPAIGNAVITKNSGALNVLPYAVLSDGVRRDELTVGEEYTLSFKALIKEDALPILVNGDAVLWDSTGNEFEDYTWVKVDLEFVAISNNLDWIVADGHNLTEYFRIDDVIIHKKVNDNVVKDWDMDEDNTDNWPAFGSASVSKTDADEYGSRSLHIEVTTTLTDGSRQSCLAIGKKYFVLAFAICYAAEGTGKVAIRNNGVTVAETVGGSTHLEKLSGVFTATSQYLDIVLSDYSGEFPDDIYIDSVIAVEIPVNRIRDITPVNLVEDGDMEKTALPNWTPVNSGTLSKITTDQYNGTRCLKVAYNSVADPGFKSSFRTEVGKNYLIVCASKGDGVCNRRIDIGTSETLYQWGDDAEWDLQVIKHRETEDSREILFISEASSAGEYSLFDNILIIPLQIHYENVPYRTTNYNIIRDGDCEQNDGGDFWTAINSAAVGKTTIEFVSPGTRSLYVSNTGPSEHGVKQSNLIVGAKYYLYGKVKRDDTVSGMAPTVYNNSTIIWLGSDTDDDWQTVQAVFIASHVDLVIKGIGSSDTFYLDNFVCVRLDPQNYSSVNTVLPSGRSLTFDESEYIDCNVIGEDLYEHWTIEIVTSVKNHTNTIVSRKDDSNTQWEIGINPSVKAIVNGTTGSVTGNTVLMDSPLYQEGQRHIVVTHDGTDTNIYVDGKLDATGTITCTKYYLNTIIGAIDDGASSLFDGEISYISFYNEKKNAEWVYSAYRKWIDVLWSGSDARKALKGVNQISKDRELGTKKIRANTFLDAKNASDTYWYSTGRSEKQFLISGTGDAPTINSASEFPSDKSIIFKTSGKYFIAQDETLADIAQIDCIFNFVVYNAGGAHNIIEKDNGSSGYSFKISSSNKLEMWFRANSGAFYDSVESDMLPLNTWCYLSIAISYSGNSVQMFCNRESILTTTTLPTTMTLSNSTYAKVSLQESTSSNTKIVFVGMWTENLWFNGAIDNIFFENEFADYNLEKLSDSFPVAGAYCKQEIAEEKIPTYSTQPGLLNIYDDNELTINGITEKPILCFRGVDADESYGVWFPYNRPQTEQLTESGSGSDIEYQQWTEMNNEDRSVLYSGGIYHRRTDTSFADIDLEDFVLEAIVKIDASASIIQKRPSKGWSISYFTSTKRFSLTVSDGTTTLTTYSDNNSAEADVYHHLMVIFKMAKGTGSQSAKFYIDGVPSATNTFSGISSLSNSGYFNIKTTAGNLNVSFIRMWKRYDWIDSASQDSVASKYYTNYKNGGLTRYANIPISAFAWGDNIGAIPMFMIKNATTGLWEKLWHGSTRDIMQQMDAVIEGGVSEIRLFPKYELLGHVNIDDILSIDQQIKFIELPKELRRMFYRILGQSKKITTWAGLLIDWI